MELPGELWLAQADYDLSVAQLLYQQEVYRYCVFFCHLALEKALKGIVLEHGATSRPPRIHNLNRLARIAGIDMPSGYTELLSYLSAQSVSARYPNDLSGYNADIAYDVLLQTNEVYEWLRARTAS